MLQFFKKANESPVQVQCMIEDAWGWCTGMTQRDGMGREVCLGKSEDGILHTGDHF